MSSEDIGLAVLVVVIAAATAFAVGIPSCENGQKWVRMEAVEAGHAEWVVVDETGKTEFRWKEATDE